MIIFDTGKPRCRAIAVAESLRTPKVLRFEIHRQRYKPAWQREILGGPTSGLTHYSAAKRRLKEN